MPHQNLLYSLITFISSPGIFHCIIIINIHIMCNIYSFLLGVVSFNYFCPTKFPLSPCIACPLPRTAFTIPILGPLSNNHFRIHYYLPPQPVHPPPLSFSSRPPLTSFVHPLSYSNFSPCHLFHGMGVLYPMDCIISPLSVAIIYHLVSGIKFYLLFLIYYYCFLSICLLLLFIPLIFFSPPLVFHIYHYFIIILFYYLRSPLTYIFSVLSPP